ncbi:inositol monophosphatase family protein [Posidoniimonas polymericola]|uniref:inositol monophosphatase family protein n=1 Tax=Posidoniimonas polymericola TaxID=2528002 RepID=UPI0018D29808
MAKQAGRAGGQRLMELRDSFEVSEKGSFDFVTNADIASQKAVFECISDSYPYHLLMGEEGDTHGPPADDESIVWVVDPLDGTTNYLHQFPFFAVSIAAVQASRPRAACVYDPLHDDFYWAAEGAGAWRNEERLQVSGAERLSDSLLSMSLPPQVASDSPDLLDFLNLVRECQAIRRTGSAAMNLALLAAGKIDGYWARQIKPWDVAAGVLLIQEAGGVVSNPVGDPFDLWQANLTAACSAGVHHELVSHLSR